MRDLLPQGGRTRKSGVMIVVIASGVIRIGDRIGDCIEVSLLPGPHRPLDRV